jgi:hypothetical protein
MKTRTLSQFAPDLRGRGRAAAAANDVQTPVLHVNADLPLNEDIADFGDVFAQRAIHSVSFDVDGDTALATLAEVYAYRVVRAYRFADEGRLKWHRLVLRFARDVFVIVRNWGTAHIYAGSAEKVEALHAELAAVLGDVPKPEEPAFYMLRRDDGDITAEAITNVPDALSDEFIRLAYGEDAGGWVDAFTQRTRSRTGGLTILEGPPGTGKTSLVSELIRRLRETHLFYVLPVCNDGTLTSPDWVSFWQGQNRVHSDRTKVVVMEDAERILLGRNGAENDAVASVLNIADGLLGRMLKLHLLCSVNARLESLDPAIQRPGRLMNYRRFAPMPRDRAVALAKLQGSAFSPADDVQEFTLAQVLQPSPVEPRTERRSIGFAAK